MWGAGGRIRGRPSARRERHGTSTGRRSGFPRGAGSHGRTGGPATFPPPRWTWRERSSGSPVRRGSKARASSSRGRISPGNGKRGRSRWRPRGAGYLRRCVPGERGETDADPSDLRGAFARRRRVRGRLGAGARGSLRPGAGQPPDRRHRRPRQRRQRAQPGDLRGERGGAAGRRHAVLRPDPGRILPRGGGHRPDRSGGERPDRPGGTGGPFGTGHLPQSRAADRPHRGRDAPAGTEHHQGGDAHHLPAGEPLRGDRRQGRRPRPGGDQPQGNPGDVPEVTGRETTGRDVHPHRRREDREGKILAVEELYKRSRRREVVKGVSLEARSGEVVGLLGPNGAGKTTIFYMMVGLVRPDAGKGLLNGDAVTDLPMHRRARMGLGYLPQEPSVFRKLTVRDNILAFLEETPLSPGERRERADGILREMRIGHVADTMGYALSGGERRRVEIARALVLSPGFLLLDEPFAGIDPISVAVLQQVILGLKERGIGVIMTDHNVRDTLKVCDRAYIISEGEILLAGKPGEIAASDRVREIYLGDGFSL